MTHHTDLNPLPGTVQGFLAAHIVHDADTASSFLSEDAVVVDQNESFSGREQIHAFLRDAGSEFDYTTEQIGAARIDHDHWIVTLRLEGTFPGGIAELDYRFSLRENVITELVIANHES